MRCPKCGAFLEENAKKCLMCGTEFGEKKEQNTNQVQNGFFSASENNLGLNSYQEDYLKKKEEYDNRLNDYRNVEINVKKEDRDLIDFYLQHKKIINGLIIVLIISGIIWGIYKLYKSKKEEIPKEAIVGELYYEINESFVAIDNANNRIVYSKSGEKGSDCSISIRYGSSTSGNHVKDYFDEALQKLEPAKDRDGNILNELDVYFKTEDEQEIHNIKWYRLNVFYRPNLNILEYSHLKNRYISNVHNGFYYDIEIVNHAQTNFCNSSLDSFIQSLEFIDKKEE